MTASYASLLNHEHAYLRPEGPTREEQGLHAPADLSAAGSEFYVGIDR